MRTREAIAAAKAEARSCGKGVAVIELLRPEAGEMRVFPCRSAWLDALPEDHPIWAKGPWLVGIAAADGSFQQEW